MLGLQLKVVQPIALEDWEKEFDASIYWIIQPNHARSVRWFWKDITKAHITKEYIPPTLVRRKDVDVTLIALCKPYTKLNLPDTYSLYSQEGESIGVASISSLTVSQDIKKAIKENVENTGVPVEVKWNKDFEKYSIVRLMPVESPISTATYFQKERILSSNR
jgi:hypothetical protein